MHLDIVQCQHSHLNHLYAPPKPVIQRRHRGAFCCLADAGATKRVTGGKIVQKRTLCQLEPGVPSGLERLAGKEGHLARCPAHFHARQSGSPTGRVFLAVATVVKVG
ncbi:hypothetical protein M422DRAFT_263101 [Sphaerobolus stellatus SS14]|uniref:Uncharacterized protein n=1 Tax=Sphaerobolus stellatus (strain SS14) TaxID=990650 RepID=A0A0C9UZK6_SPHS4|nr:hypothetical protein M422DRAFT_263101 [Sphaerobolus stellatus SS14]